MPRYNIHSLWGSAFKSVGASAVTLGSDIEWVEEPTKLIRITFKFLSNNTTTGFTVANILTQMGTTLVLQGPKVGKIIDGLQMADFFYTMWFLRGDPPVNFGGTTNNYVCAVIMDYWFGRPNRPNEGLPSRNMILSWALPADGNEIDTRTVEILQFTQEGANYTHGLYYEGKNGPTPSTTTRKNFEFPMLQPNALDQEAFLDLLFMTTGLGATATDTTTIDTLQLMKNGNPVGDIHQPEGWQGMLPANSEDICVIAHTFPKTYIPFHWEALYNRPMHLRSHGISKNYGIYFMGGDTNAIRVSHVALKKYPPLGD